MKNLFTLLAVTFLTVSVTAQTLSGTYNIVGTKLNNATYGTPTSSFKVHFNSNNYEVQFCDVSSIAYGNCIIDNGLITTTSYDISFLSYCSANTATNNATDIVGIVFGCALTSQSNITVTQSNGIYSLKRTCGGLVYEALLSQGTAGIEDNYFSDSQVYPNPTTGLINVTNYPVDLFDQYGAKVTTITTPQFDLSSLPKGLYFIANKKVVLL